MAHNTQKTMVLCFYLILVFGCQQTSNKSITEQQAQQEDPFFALFKSDPPSGFQSSTCPTWPQSNESFLVAEALNNYNLLKGNSQYGNTGLMAVNSWTSPCYGDVKPGTSFLFPGTADANATWSGDLPSINCQKIQPNLLTSTSGTLHEQMAKQLGRPTTDFVGFATRLTNQGNVNGYNSGTCNHHWFGSRTLGTCDGNNWKILVKDVLNTGLKDCKFVLNSSNVYKKDLVVCKDIYINLDSSAHFDVKHVVAANISVDMNNSSLFTTTKFDCVDADIDIKKSSKMYFDSAKCHEDFTLKTKYSGFVYVYDELNLNKFSLTHTYSSSFYLPELNAENLILDVDYSSRLDILGGNARNISGSVDHTSFVKNLGNFNSLNVTVDKKHKAPYTPFLGLGSTYTEK